MQLLEAAAEAFDLQPELHDFVIADETRGHFQLLRVGWVQDERLLQILMHFDLTSEGKIWIQQNTTEVPVDEELVKLGVPNSDIVLAMHPLTYRHSPILH